MGVRVCPRARGVHCTLGCGVCAGPWCCSGICEISTNVQSLQPGGILLRAHVVHSWNVMTLIPILYYYYLYKIYIYYYYIGIGRVGLQIIPLFYMG